jgi:hypothetical protein
MQAINAQGSVRTADRDVLDAYFLHTHPGWKPEDLGYPPGDFILIDLMRMLNK